MAEQHRHYLRIHGPGADPTRVSGQLFRDLLSVLVDGTKGALRLKIEGMSSPHGAPPKWLLPAADFTLRFLPPRKKSAIALIEARPLKESLASRFESQQKDFFKKGDELDPNKSPIELFEDALEDALRGEDDSLLFDAGLIKTFERFGDLFKRGDQIQRLDIINGRELRIDAMALEGVRKLAKRTKTPQAVVVAGRLEAIQWSDCRFKLVLPDKSSFYGAAPELGSAVLKKHWGHDVVVRGEMHYRPSGAVLRIVTKSIEPVTDENRAALAINPISLSAKEHDTFIKLLKDPPAPNEKLIEAMKRFKQ